MCIAIYQPAGKRLDDEMIENCYLNNGDGCGFSYINTDINGIKRLIIKKFMDLGPFKKQYERALRIAPDSPFLIHFRIRTHGEISTYNCHPFKIDKDHVFIHNGIIPSMRKDKKKNDTRVFQEDYLKELPEGWMFNTGIKKLLENVISNSKIVVMNIDGDVMICNEDKGHWHEEMWFSNHSYDDYLPIVYTKRAATSKWSYGDYDDYYDYNSSHKKENKRLFSGSSKGVGDEDPNRWHENDMVQCDSCTTLTTVKDMLTYLDTLTSVPRAICSTCAITLASSVNSLYLLDTDSFLDYLNLEPEDTYQTDEDKEMPTGWRNPWLATGPDGEIEGRPW